MLIHSSLKKTDSTLVCLLYTSIYTSSYELFSLAYYLLIWNISLLQCIKTTIALSHMFIFFHIILNVSNNVQTQKNV